MSFLVLIKKKNLQAFSIGPAVRNGHRNFCSNITLGWTEEARYRVVSRVVCHIDSQEVGRIEISLIIANEHFCNGASHFGFTRTRWTKEKKNADGTIFITHATFEANKIFGYRARCF